MRRLGVPVLLVALVFAAVACHDGSSTATPVSYSAVAYPDGAPVSLADLHGRPVLLNAWATWCSECREELPQLQRLWTRDRTRGLVVVAVNVDGGSALAPVGRMASEFSLTMPLWSDAQGTFSTTFSAIGTPTTVLLDRTGRVVQVWQGATDFEDPAVQQIIDTALSGTSRPATPAPVGAAT
jgi:peroxiredoxin